MISELNQYLSDTVAKELNMSELWQPNHKVMFVLKNIIVWLKHCDYYAKILCCL